MGCDEALPQATPRTVGRGEGGLQSNRAKMGDLHGAGLPGVAYGACGACGPGTAGRCPGPTGRTSASGPRLASVGLNWLLGPPLDGLGQPAGGCLTANLGF